MPSTVCSFFKVIFHDKHTLFTFTHYKDYDTQGSITNFAYIPGAFWTIQHLTDTFPFEDHWPDDLHVLEERRLILLLPCCYGRSTENL